MAKYTNTTEAAPEAEGEAPGFTMSTEVVYRESGPVKFVSGGEGPRTVGEMIDRQLDSLAFSDGDMRDVHLEFSPDDWSRIRDMYKALDMFGTAEHARRRK